MKKRLVDGLRVKIDYLVRSHTRTEPYISNVVDRIILLIEQAGVEVHSEIPDPKNYKEYKRAYNSGYIAGKRSQSGSKGDK